MTPEQLRHELSSCRLDELRGLARTLGLSGYSSASKGRLVEELLAVKPEKLQQQLDARPTADSPAGREGGYRPALWERICAMVTAMTVVGLVIWLALRNEPFGDPNLVTLIRIVLSVAVAIIGATVPGILHVDMSAPGIMIRAGGALALFLLTFFGAPRVLKSIDPVSAVEFSNPMVINKADGDIAKHSAEYELGDSLEEIRDVIESGPADPNTGIVAVSDGLYWRSTQLPTLSNPVVTIRGFDIRSQGEGHAYIFAPRNGPEPMYRQSSVTDREVVFRFNGDTAANSIACILYVIEAGSQNLEDYKKLDVSLTAGD